MQIMHPSNANNTAAAGSIVAHHAGNSNNYRCPLGYKKSMDRGTIVSIRVQEMKNKSIIQILL